MNTVRSEDLYVIRRLSEEGLVSVLGKASWIPFEEALVYVRSLGLSSKSEWSVYCASGNKPEGIPSNPRKVYKEEWVGMGHWLGTGNIMTQRWVFRPFKEAREFVRSLRLRNLREWERYRKSVRRPKDIPTNPNCTYRDEWRGLGDWLGTGNITSREKVFRPFNEARLFVHSLGLNSAAEWRAYSVSKRPEDIPAAPQNTYISEWKGWGDWLGTGSVATQRRVFRPFKEARTFARSLGLSSQREWIEYSKSGKRPYDIPSDPQTVYKDDWKSMGDWLGTGSVAPQYRVFRPFLEARTFVRSLSLRTWAEWEFYTKSGKKPKDIPVSPQRTYKDDWGGMADWLGTA